MDAKELRGLLKEWTATDEHVSKLTKPKSSPFYRWWYDEYLTKEQQAMVPSGLLPYTMLELSDEELMFLWAVYLM